MNVEERIRAILIQRFKRSAYWILRYLSCRRDPNIKDNFGMTLLHMVASASLDNLAIVQCLVELGADINVQDKYHLTPLHLAVRHSNYKIADFLINQGAEVNIQEKNGHTALDMLIGDMEKLKKQREREKEEKSLGLVRKLLQRGADPNLPDIKGETSLFRAVRQNNFTVVKELLMFGANVHLRNVESDTCLHRLLWLNKPDNGILVELVKMEPVSTASAVMVIVL